MERKGWQRGGGCSFFFVFNRKRKRKWKKYFVHFVGNLSRIPKLFFFFHFSIKTEEILLFYMYIYLYIYKKLSWKNCHEQKVFLFRFYILCENFSKIGLIIKKWGAKRLHRGSKFDFFQCLFSLSIHLFI